MSEIPEDIRKNAWAVIKIISDDFTKQPLDIVAAALIAERERCAFLAAGDFASTDFDKLRLDMRDEESGYASGRLDAARAIRGKA